MELSEVRRIVIVAMFSDDALLDQLVLKGGNALDIVHGLGGRGSLDLDFSLASDFPDTTEAERRIFDALRDRFDSAGFVLFDESFEVMPPTTNTSPPIWWGGYRVRFKIIEKEKYDRLGADIGAVRRNAIPVGLRDSTVFKIDISRYEFCQHKLKTELDDYTIYVYSREMIAIEKLRAICQQMPEYETIPPNAKRARARDFYDIYQVVESGIDLASEENRELIESIFGAKQVPLELLSKIEEVRAFHRPDWPSVVDTVRGEIKDFDYYFDFIVALVNRLKPLWEE